MKTITRLSLVMVLIGALVLSSACANISNDRTRTQTEGTLAGAGIGAALGAIIGAATGSSKGALRGALIGGAAGAVGGLAYGTHVANKKAEYASEEAWLADCLAQAKSANQSAAAYNKKLKSTLAGYKSGAKTAGYSFSDSGQPSAANQEAKNLKRDLKESQETLNYLDYEISGQQAAVASAGSNAQTKQIQKEIKELEKQRDQLKQTNQELAAISSRIAI